MKQHIVKLLISIQNAQLVKKLLLLATYSNKLLLELLWNKGFLKSYSKDQTYYKIFLRHTKDQTVFKSFNIGLKKSRFIFFSAKKIWKIKFMRAFYIFSSTFGVVNLSFCKRLKIGAKLLSSIN